MAIMDDNKHVDKHFPEYLLNGRWYGWCFLRKLIHIEFYNRDKKIKWTMWSAARIYSTLLNHNLKPISMEQQDQETSQVGAADAQQNSDDEDLESEDKDSEGGDKKPDNSPAGPADGAKAPSSK
jgi:hypothetical protein